MRNKYHLAAWLSLGVAASGAASQAGGHAIIEGQYSSMAIEKGSGDFVGYDVRVLHTDDTYRVVLFCSEGGLIGPIKEELHPENGAAVIHPRNGDCGKKIELVFTPKGILISTEYISKELIPRHKNYLKEEHWK